MFHPEVSAVRCRQIKRRVRETHKNYQSEQLSFIKEFRKILGHPCACFNLLTDKALLARYLKIYSFRLDRAQQLLVHGLEFRKKNPWFFTKRDANAPDMRFVVDMV